jgi:hypothetical protein
VQFNSKRATVAEVHKRVIGVAKLLVKRLHDYQIRQFLTEKYDLSSRMANTYISRAREYLIEQSGRSREEFVSEAVGFYEGVLRDPEAILRDKFMAQAALRELLGLDMPFKIAPSLPDGEAIPATLVADMSMEELAVLRSLHLRVQAARTATLPALV